MIQPNLTPEAAEGLLAECARVQLLWTPPPRLTIAEWAERNRVIPKGASARPGPWVTESYQREIMECITDPTVGRVVVRKSTQIGWSEILNNVIGYFIDADPKPIMMVQPTDTNAKQYSRKRIQKGLIDTCPALKAKVRESTSRQAGNTMLLKEFDGGFLKITGAQAGAGLRSDPVAVLALDEVDGYPLDVDGEGSPIQIAGHRTETFDDAKTLVGSTPAKPKGISPIDDEFEKSSQGYYHVPCMACGEMQPLLWRDPKDPKRYYLKFTVDNNRDVIASTVRYECRACGHLHDEKFKRRMLNAGKWVHSFPERKVRGFQINALMSPWKLIWAKLAQDWIDAQDDPEKLKAFINLSLGETFDESGEQVEPHVLRARAEKYWSPDEHTAIGVPRNCCVLVGSVDVQHNRVEIQITGFGVGEESWLIDHHIVWGDPGLEETWAEVDQFLLQPYPHECGAQMYPVITLVDSGDGGHADNVYDYVLPRQNTRRRIYACKGVEYLTKPVLAVEGTAKRDNVRLWTVATFAAKDRIFARLKIAPPKEPPPKPVPCIHFPEWVTDEYLEQLLSEKKMPKKNKRTRRTKYEYVQVNPRNEALDLTVYAHAALFILQNYLDPVTFRDLTALAARVHAGSAPGTLTTQRPRRMRNPGITGQA